MFVLPVSGTPVSLSVPTGHDDVFLAESSASDVGVRLDVVRRLVRPVTAGIDWSALPYVDVDAGLLALRQFLAGDRLVAEVHCSACGEWCDLTLSIDEYFKANRPRAARGTLPLKIPAAGHVLAAVQVHGPGEAAAALEQESLKDCGPRDSRRALALLEKLAPPLTGPVAGKCPHCGMDVLAWFDPGAFVISELRSRAGSVFEEVHLLASRYGWTEDVVLSMPAPRRAAYAALIASEAGTS